MKYDVIVGNDLSLFTNQNDQIGATLRLDAGPTLGASNNSTFIIRAYGDTTGGAGQALAWGAYNGGKNDGGFSAANFQNMGMLIAANTTYTFTIDVHADTLDYDISIFNGTATVSLADRGWRSTLDGTNSDLVFIGRQDINTDAFRTASTIFRSPSFPNRVPSHFSASQASPCCAAGVSAEWG